MYRVENLRRKKVYSGTAPRYALALSKPISVTSFSDQSLIEIGYNAKQGIALTGRNRTGPTCSVGRPTAHAPGLAAADRRRVRPARPSAKLQTTTTDDDRRQRAKQYWSIRRASNDTCHCQIALNGAIELTQSSQVSCAYTSNV